MHMSTFWWVKSLSGLVHFFNTISNAKNLHVHMKNVLIFRLESHSRTRKMDWPLYQTYVVWFLLHIWSIVLYSGLMQLIVPYSIFKLLSPKYFFLKVSTQKQWQYLSQEKVHRIYWTGHLRTQIHVPIFSLWLYYSHFSTYL